MLYLALSHTVMRGTATLCGMRNLPVPQPCGCQAQPLPHGRRILCRRGGAHKEGVLGVQTGPKALRAQLQAGTAAAAVQRSWNGRLHAGGRWLSPFHSFVLPSGSWAAELMHSVNCVSWQAWVLEHRTDGCLHSGELWRL